MEKICTATLYLLFSLNVVGQQNKLAVPILENLNIKDTYPAKSLMATYTDNFDVIISFGTYSNWVAFSEAKTALAHKENGWYKIQLETSYIFSDTTKTIMSIIKINDRDGEALWNILTQNKLFSMEDERTIKMPACSYAIYDAGQYEFEILTADKYKKLCFYEPRYYEEHCPGMAERKQILSCITAFEKYLGK